MYHPNADCYRDLTAKQISKKHENEKKGQYAERVMEIAQGTFTPLVFTTTGGMADKCVGMADKCVGMADKCVGMADKCVGMADECVKHHSRLAELIASKKGECYSSAISWIRAKVSFAIIRPAQGSRSRRRHQDFADSELQIDNIRACPN